MEIPIDCECDYMITQINYKKANVIEKSIHGTWLVL